MNKEEPYRDQAERLRKKIEKTTNAPEIKKELPSRSDLHRDRKNKTKWKLKYPVIRLLVLFFVLLPIAILSAISALNNSEKVSKEDNENKGYDVVNVKQNEEKEEVTKPNIDDEEKIVETIGEDEKTGSKLEDENQSEQITNAEGEKAKSPSTDKDQTTSIEKEKESSILIHTVQPKENLYRIAMKYYQSPAGVEIIKQANHIQGVEIRVGQELKIPK